jgi:hypothetical protein
MRGSLAVVICPKLPDAMLPFGSKKKTIPRWKRAGFHAKLGERIRERDRHIHICKPIFVIPSSSR